MKATAREKLVLEALQFLHSVADRGSRLADELDPKRTLGMTHAFASPEDVARDCDGLSARARSTFFHVVELPAYEVSAVELSTLNPSARVLAGVKANLARVKSETRTINQMAQKMDYAMKSGKAGG